MLGQVDVKQRQPVLKRLQSEPAKNESDAEDPKPSLRKIVGVVLDVRINGLSHARDNAGHKPYSDCESPIHVMDESATDEGGCEIPNRADDSSPKLTSRQPRTARCHVIHARTAATPIAKYLANDDEEGKRSRELEADNPVESDSKTNSADKGAEPLPGQRIMIQSTSYSIEFGRGSNARRDTGGEAEEGTEADAVTDAEDDRVGYGPRKQSQWTMLAAQKIVSKIKAAHYIETTARDADACDDVVIQS